MYRGNTRMAQWLDYRVRVTISDARMLVGTFMAFDKYMNVVLADCEEFRKIKSKGRKDEEKEVKRTLGFAPLFNSKRALRELAERAS